MTYVLSKTKNKPEQSSLCSDGSRDNKKDIRPFQCMGVNPCKFLRLLKKASTSRVQQQKKKPSLNANMRPGSAWCLTVTKQIPVKNCIITKKATFRLIKMQLLTCVTVMKKIPIKNSLLSSFDFHIIIFNFIHFRIFFVQTFPKGRNYTTR